MSAQTMHTTSTTSTTMNTTISAADATGAAGAARRRERGASRSALKMGRVAWPTLALSAAALGVWASAVTLAVSGVIPLWLGAVLCAVASFATFTPMHDASHQSVARTGWLNEAVGRLSALPLMAPFLAFRYLHLEHHKHTNEPEHDPDHWSGRGPWWALPLRWMTQDVHYYAVYWRAQTSRPRRERVEVWATFAAQALVVAALVAAGYGWEVLALWLIPSRVAMAALAFAFDYFPHRPHATPAKEDRYAATALYSDGWLTPIMLYQNYHLIHHLYPGVPFYRYSQVWRERRAQLERKGVKARRLIGEP